MPSPRSHTLVVEAVELVRLGSVGVAAAYLVLSVAAGTAAVLASMTVTRRVLRAVRAVPLA